MRYSISVFTMPRARDPRSGEEIGQVGDGAFVTYGPSYADESSAEHEFRLAEAAFKERVGLHLPWLEADAGTVVHCRFHRVPATRRA
jgi:hypothetical protein